MFSLTKLSKNLQKLTGETLDKKQPKPLDLKGNQNSVVYYNLKNRQDLTSYFKPNDTAQKVHSFYQHGV